MADDEAARAAAHARNAWAAEALRRLRTHGTGTAPTPLVPVPLPALPDVRVYVKDESAHPTGSVKYRLVRAMYARAVECGTLGEGTPVVTATSGPVAVAGAVLARLLDLPFTAVVPASAPAEARARIEEEGGVWRVSARPPAALQEEGREVAASLGGHFLDHFADGARAAAECGGPTLADEIFDGVRELGHPAPEWIVTGAATGATSATAGRHIRRHGLSTRLAVADPEDSAYFPAWASGAADYATGMPSRVPGIGRPRVEPGFLPDVVDMVVPVPDAAGAAAHRWLHAAGVPSGPATGTVFWAACRLLAAPGRRRRCAPGRSGTFVLVSGASAPPGTGPGLAAGMGRDAYDAQLAAFLTSGHWPGEPGAEAARPPGS